MNSPLPRNFTRDASNASRELSDKVLQSAQEAVESTRDLANHALSNALSSADSKVRDMRGRIDPAIEEFASSAQRLARRGIDLATDTGSRAQKSLHQYAAVTERYVADQPVKAVLIAAAAGAVIAALLLSARKRRNPEQH